MTIGNITLNAAGLMKSKLQSTKLDLWLEQII